MKSIALCVSLVALAACGSSSSTGTSSTRWNFAVVDGRNQASAAGSSALAKPITSQLTIDPSGKFATRVFDFFAPAVAYAQGLTLSGTPVAGAIVCGRVAPIGEPQVVPLCAFTLADGKAANSVQGGTKAGTYNILFTAQVPSQLPVADSTTVTVQAGPANPDYHGSISAYTRSPTVVSEFGVQDRYGNAVPFRIVADGRIVVGDVAVGTVSARTVTFTNNEADNLYHITELRGVGDVLVGYLRYRLCPNSCAGSVPPGEAAFNWVSGGANVPSP